MGMVSSEFSTPMILQSTGNIFFPFATASLVTIVAFTSACVVVYIDKLNHKRVKQMLNRQDTLEANYFKRHNHDLDIFEREREGAEDKNGGLVFEMANAEESEESIS